MNTNGRQLPLRDASPGGTVAVAALLVVPARGDRAPIATPFGWKFTRRDLRKLLHRIEHHQNNNPDHRQAA